MVMDRLGQIFKVAMTEESVNAIIDGKGSMPGFENYFTDQEIADLVAFVETL